MLNWEGNSELGMLFLKLLYTTVSVSGKKERKKTITKKKTTHTKKPTTTTATAPGLEFIFFLAYILPVSAAVCHHFSESEENMCFIGMLCPILIKT